MTPTITTLRADSTPDEAIEVIESEGGVIVEHAVSAEIIRRLNNDLEATAAVWPPGSRFDDEIMRMAHGARTKRFTSLPSRSAAFLDLMSDARVAAVADHYLLPNCGSYCLNTGQLMQIGPGEPAQVLHRDDLNWPGARPGYPFSVHTITALTDFTTDNGATVVAPNSQSWEDPDRYPTDDELTQAVMPACSMLIYTGQLIHGAGANKTASENRRAIEMSFVLGWLRTEENHCLVIPAQVAGTYPERIQTLLGFRGYEHRSPAGRLGLVDYSDPVHYLREHGYVGEGAEEGGVWPLRLSRRVQNGAKAPVG